MLFRSLVGGVLKSPVVRLRGADTFEATATLSLLAIDTSNDGIEELFVSERIPSPTTPGVSTLRLWQVPLLAGDPAVAGEAEPVVELAAGADARMLLGDATADGIPEVIALWRGADGSLELSMALGAGSPPVSDWALGDFTARSEEHTSELQSH